MPPSLSSPVFVSGEAARTVFKWKDAIAALQAAYALPVDPHATPPRTIANSGKTWLRTLPAIPPGGRYYGAKLMGMDNASATPGVEYVIVLYDHQTSRIAAFVDGNVVTGLRTAATSAAALDKIVSQRPLRLAVLGSGLEASMHVRAFASTRTLTDIRVYSPTQARREAFASEAQHDLGVPAKGVASAQEAVADADLVLAAARSRGEQPILYAQWLKSDAIVFSIGSTIPEQREIDISVIDRSDLIVADSLDEVLEQTGDMIAARQNGLIFHDKAISLNDLCAGRHPQKITAAKTPLFKSVGGGLQDIIVAELILSRALEAGLAIPLPIVFETKN